MAQKAKLVKPNPTVYIDKARAAEILGVSVRTVDRYIASGLIPSFSPSARVVRMRESDVHAMMEKHQVRTMRGVA